MFGRSIHWFDFICRSWVEASCSSSKLALHSSTKTLDLSFRLCLRASCSTITLIFILIAVSFSINLSFTWVLPRVSNSLWAVISDDMRWWWSELHRRMASGITFGEIETKIGLCLSIFFVISVSFHVPSFTEIESKSETAKFSKKWFCSL